MRVVFDSIADFRDEIDWAFDNGIAIRGGAVRYANAEIAQQEKPPFVTFEIACILTAIIETPVEPTLLECPISFGVSLQPTNPKANDDDQPEPTRKRFLEKNAEHFKSKNLRFTKGKIELI